METIKIGFGYKARRGKDTAVKQIIQTVGGMLYARQYAFADKLRDEIHRAVFDRWVRDYSLPFDGPRAMEHLCAWAGVSYDPNAEMSLSYPFGKQRPLYQWWGDWRRSQNPAHWVEPVDERIKRDEPVFALLSDMRYFNEFEFCDYRIRCDRPGFEINDGAHHISETQLDMLPDERWDGIITATCAEQVKRQAMYHFRRIAREVDAKRYAARLAAHSAPAGARPVQ